MTVVRQARRPRGADHKPSEYFDRQCALGSSIFSLAEMEARHEIGIDKMMLGFDYPHHEGAWAAGPGLVPYIQATLGVAKVPPHAAPSSCPGTSPASGASTSMPSVPSPIESAPRSRSS